MAALRTLVREPLLHFLLIGLALFLWYGRVAPAGTDASRIVVTQAQVDVLARQFEATWGRPPSERNYSHDSFHSLAGHRHFLADVDPDRRRAN